jgi:hypothetical protein
MIRRTHTAKHASHRLSPGYVLRHQNRSTATINETINPAGTAGTVVNGTLYVETFLGAVASYGQQQATS